MFLRKAKSFALSVVADLTDAIEAKPKNSTISEEPFTIIYTPKPDNSLPQGQPDQLASSSNSASSSSQLCETHKPQPRPTSLTNFKEATIVHCGLLPEIWEKILGFLSPTDFLSAINSFPEWRDVIKCQTPSILLPLVLPVLADNLKHPHKPILAWRGVNQKAKFVLDQILAEASTSSQIYYESHTSQAWSMELKAKELEKRQRLIGWLKFQYVFRKKEEMHKFLKHMGDGVSVVPVPYENPIISKSIHIKLDVNLERPEELEEIQARLDFLFRFGPHINDMTCSFSGNIFGESLRHFVEVLNLIPDLKNIHFCNSLGLVGDSTLGLYRDIEFPPLKELKLLDVELFFENWMMDEQYSLIRLLLKNYGAQITTLLCAENFFKVVNKPLLFSNLPNLRVLRLRSVDRTTISILSQVNWKLEEIQVCNFNLRDRGPGFMPVPPYCIKRDDVVRAEELFEMLNNFKETLIHVQLNLKIDKEHFAKQPIDSFLGGTGTYNECPKVTKLTAAYSNINVSMFWGLIKHKFPNVVELEMYTTGKVTDKKIHYAKMCFVLLKKLERIRIWCAKPGWRESSWRVITRNSLKLGEGESQNMFLRKNAIRMVTSSPIGQQLASDFLDSF